MLFRLVVARTHYVNLIDFDLFLFFSKKLDQRFRVLQITFNLLRQRGFHIFVDGRPRPLVKKLGSKNIAINF